MVYLWYSWNSLRYLVHHAWPHLWPMNVLQEIVFFYSDLGLPLISHSRHLQNLYYRWMFGPHWQSCFCLVLLDQYCGIDLTPHFAFHEDDWHYCDRQMREAVFLIYLTSYEDHVELTRVAICSLKKFGHLVHNVLMLTVSLDRNCY